MEADGAAWTEWQRGTGQISDREADDRMHDADIDRADDLYDIARRATDAALGAGAYAEHNRGNRDPRVQRAIERGERERLDD